MSPADIHLHAVHGVVKQQLLPGYVIQPLITCDEDLYVRLLSPDGDIVNVFEINDTAILNLIDAARKHADFSCK